MFVRTKTKAENLTKYLEDDGFIVATIHKGIGPNARQQTLDTFKEGKIQVFSFF